MSGFLLVSGKLTDNESLAFEKARARLVIRPWQTLHILDRPDFRLAWTDSHGTATFVQREDDFALILGWPLRETVVETQLQTILEDLRPEIASRSLTQLDGRYVGLFYKSSVLYVTTDLLAAVRTYYTSQGDSFAYSTEMKCLSMLYGLGINPLGVKQKLLFSANYRSSILEGVEYLGQDCVRKHESLQEVSCTEESLHRLRYCPEYSHLTEKEALDVVGENMVSSVLSNGLSRIDGVSVCLSSGRDSRCVLGELTQALGPERVKAVTMGNSGDFEVELARKVAQVANVEHTIVPIAPLQSINFDRFVWMTEDFDISALAHCQLVETLRELGSPVVESTSPEIFWGHTEYGKGAGSFCRNFVSNRASAVPLDKVKDGERIRFVTEEEAAEIVERFPGDLPTYAQTDLLDLSAFQARWCFMMHRTYDAAAGCVSVYLNRKLMDIFLGLPECLLRDHHLYLSYCLSRHRNIFAVPCSRDFGNLEWPPRPGNIRGFMLGKYHRLARRYTFGNVIARGRSELCQFMEPYKDQLEGLLEPQYVHDIFRDLSRTTLSSRVVASLKGESLDPYCLSYLACFVSWHRIINEGLDFSENPAETIHHS